ncbi:MAG: lipoprotein [Gammaproteobacteria bacterium]|nr:lipoprotein [Gammaproteobacteria bacterium]
MKIQTNRFFALLALVSLTLSLSYCGQKGGLTRSEPSAFTASNFVSGK